MIIAIEAQRIFRKNKHGMDFVALEVIRCLQSIKTHHQFYIFVAPGEDRCLDNTDNMKIIELKAPGGYPVWEQIALPLAIRKLKPDLLHCTSNTAPVLCTAPLVLTLHDIIFLEKKKGNNPSLYQKLGWYYRRMIVPRVIPKCRKIITVSQYECNRIRHELKLESNQITAIYNGFGSHFRPMIDYEPIVRKYIEDLKYIFFLGNTDPKKNTAGTLKGYADYISKSKSPLPLLIADIDKKYVDEILKKEDIEFVSDYLRYPGYIPNSDLPAIYNGAFAFLYPSYRESFGIPILEAMACETPVITSDTSAIPEIAGKGAILINPYHPDSIAKALLKLESDSEFYAEQIKKGRERSDWFSWEITAQRTLALYESIISPKGSSIVNQTEE